MTFAPAPVHRRHPLHADPAAVAVGLVVVIAFAVALAVHYGSAGSGTVQGSGTAATQSRDVPTFHSVDLAGANTVTIRIGRLQSVVVRADRNLLDRVTTRVHQDTLVIDTRGNVTTKSPMGVELVVPSLDAVTLSGTGAVRATGTAAHLDVSLPGTGDVELGGLEARSVHAALSGSGRIVVHATNTVDATVSGTGAIVYLGNPAHVTTSVTGTGAIMRG